MEADIETATIPEATTLLQDEPVIGDNTIIFKLKEFTGVYRFAPEFTLTPGASIKPASGTQLDFTQPQKYTVTSEDGAWTKVYTVSFVADDTQKRSYSFEEAEVVDTENPEDISTGFLITYGPDRKNMTGLQQMKGIMYWLKPYWKKEKR